MEDNFASNQKSDEDDNQDHDHSPRESSFDSGYTSQSGNDTDTGDASWPVALEEILNRCPPSVQHSESLHNCLAAVQEEIPMLRELQETPHEPNTNAEMEVEVDSGARDQQELPPLARCIKYVGNNTYDYSEQVLEQQELQDQHEQQQQQHYVPVWSFGYFTTTLLSTSTQSMEDFRSMELRIVREHEQATPEEHGHKDSSSIDHRRFLLRSKTMTRLVPMSMIYSSRYPGMLGYTLAYARVSGQPGHPLGLRSQFRLIYLRFGPTNYYLSHKHTATAPRNDEVQMTDLIAVLRYYNITVVVITAFDRLSRSVEQLNVLRAWCPYLRIIVVAPDPHPNMIYSVLDDIVLERITQAEGEGALIAGRNRRANFVQQYNRLHNLEEQREMVDLPAGNEWGNYVHNN